MPEQQPLPPLGTLVRWVSSRGESAVYYIHEIQEAEGTVLLKEINGNNSTYTFINHFYKRWGCLDSPPVTNRFDRILGK